MAKNAARTELAAFQAERVKAGAADLPALLRSAQKRWREIPASLALREQAAVRRLLAKYGAA